MTGTLPRRAAAPASAVAPARPWTEQRLARLAEDAARSTPAVSGPVATVRAHGSAARVDLDLMTSYGAHLPTVAAAVRRRVTARIAAHAGLAVESVTVTVVDVVQAAGRPSDGSDGARRGGGATAAGG